MRCFLIIYCTITFIIFFLKPDISQAIITPRDEDIIYKRDTEQIFSQPWENGLKEATYRVFIKEGWLEPGLKNELHVAPILGDNVPTVPFGDISMLARGQLYHNHGNLIFVRDKNLYDCENCRIQIPRKKYGDILTLWSVKRIRHRRSEDNFRYEVEYKISPILDRVYVKSNGEFNYEIPGHVFLLNQDIKESRNGNNRYYLPPYPSTTSVYFYTKRNERYTTTTVKPDVKSKLHQEIELYNKLLNSLKNHPTIDTENKMLTSTERILTTTPRVLTTSRVLTTTSRVLTTTPRSLTTTPRVLTTTPRMLTTTPRMLTTIPTILATQMMLSTTPTILKASTSFKTIPTTLTTLLLKISTTEIPKTTSTTLKPSTTKKLLPTKEDFYDIFETKRKPTTVRPKEIEQVQTPPGNDYIATATESYNKVFSPPTLKTTKSTSLIDKMLKSVEKDVDEDGFLEMTRPLWVPPTLEYQKSKASTPIKILDESGDYSTSTQFDLDSETKITEKTTSLYKEIDLETSPKPIKINLTLTKQPLINSIQVKTKIQAENKMNGVNYDDAAESTTSLKKETSSMKPQVITEKSLKSVDKVEMLDLIDNVENTTQLVVETSSKKLPTQKTLLEKASTTQQTLINFETLITNKDEHKITSLMDETTNKSEIQLRKHDETSFLTENSLYNENETETKNLFDETSPTTPFLIKTSIKYGDKSQISSLDDEIRSTTSIIQETSTKSKFLTNYNENNTELMNEKDESSPLLFDENGSTTTTEKVTSSTPLFLTKTSIKYGDKSQTSLLDDEVRSTTSIREETSTQTSNYNENKAKVVNEKDRSSPFSKETSLKHQFLTKTSFRNIDESNMMNLNDGIRSTTSIMQEISTKPSFLTEEKKNFFDENLSTTSIEKTTTEKIESTSEFITKTSLRDEISTENGITNVMNSDDREALSLIGNLSTQIFDETTWINNQNDTFLGTSPKTTSQIEATTSIIKTETPLILKNRFKPTRKPSFKPTTTEKVVSFSSKRTKKYKFSRPTKNFLKTTIRSATIKSAKTQSKTTTEKSFVTTTKRKKFNIPKRPTVNKIKSNLKTSKNQTIIVDKVETTTEKNYLKPESVKNPLIIKAPTPQTLPVPFTQDGQEILDDIFGKTSKTTKKSTTKSLRRKQNSDVDELFNKLKRKRFMKENNKRIRIKDKIKEKQNKINNENITQFKDITTQEGINIEIEPTQKIIFSDFYEASTAPNLEMDQDIPNILEVETTTNIPHKSVTEKVPFKDVNEVTTMFEYVTSTTGCDELKTTSITTEFDDYKSTTEGIITTTDLINVYEKLKIKATTEDVSAVLDNLVLSVLNNARAVKYLDRKKRIARKKKKKLVKIRNRPKME